MDRSRPDPAQPGKISPDLHAGECAPGRTRTCDRLLRRSFRHPSSPAASQLRPQITSPLAPVSDRQCPSVLARVWHVGRAPDRRSSVKPPWTVGRLSRVWSVPPDRRRGLSVEDHTQGWRLRHRVATRAQRAPLTVILPGKSMPGAGRTARSGLAGAVIAARVAQGDWTACGNGGNLRRQRRARWASARRARQAAAPE